MKETSSIVQQHRTSERIKRDLRRHLGKKWRVGERLPPIKQLAQELGIGQSNTYRAVQDLVAEGLLISSPGRGTFVNEVATASTAPVSINAQRLRKLAGKSVRIWCAWSKPDRFLRDAIDAATELFTRLGCRVGMDAPPQKASDMHDCDAVMFINPHDNPPISCADHQVMAVVDTGMDLPINMTERYDMVGFNSKHGGLLAGRHLREIGCQDICFVGCPSAYDQTSVARLNGLQCGWGQPIKPQHRLAAAYYMSIEGAMAAAQYVKLSPRPDGVCASSDELAVGFIHGAASHGLGAGRDYHLIGFDGQEFGQTATRHPLTTIKVPMAEMGRCAAELLVERMLDPARRVQCTFFAGKLIQGRTTRPHHR